MGYDNNFFMRIRVGANRRNTNQHIIQIVPPIMLLTPEKLADSRSTSDPLIKAYVNYITDVAKILGADVESMKKDFTDMLEFEHKIKNIADTSTRKGKVLKIEDLEKEYPEICWTKYINRILAPHTQVDQNEIVEVWSSSYLKAFIQLIRTTPNRIIVNYVLCDIIRQSIVTMVGRSAEAKAEYVAVSSWGGRQKPSPRQETCLNQIKSDLPLAVGALYIRQHFDRNTKIMTASLVKNIRSTFRDIIEQADWMDSATKQQALDKSDFMREIVGYPDELMDDSKLNDHFKDLKIYPESYLKSRNSVRKFTMEHDLRRLKMTRNETEWVTHGHAAIINAFYYQAENIIDIRAGYLVEEYFNTARPNYMNYGAMGYIIGHKVTHAFDTTGSNYDKNGNLVNWWQPKTREAFMKSIECIVEQYSNYTIQEINMKIDGASSQKENFADNGGLKAAYYAYNRWAKENDPEPQLPDLDYTPQQMLWISFAASNCEKLHPKWLAQFSRTDPHPQNELRVIGSVSNRPEFSKDFQCPLGSPMNPAKKCSVW